MMRAMASTKTIFITGSGSGFGWDTAIALAKRGHRVIATTHTDDASLKINSFAQANNLDIKSFALDVTVPEDRQKILDYDVDVLLNNAGVGESGSLAEISLDKIRHDFEVNVFGSIALAQLALQKFMPRDRGTILFVGSLGGRVAMPFLSSYCMTKFALSGGVDAMRQEVRRVTKNVHIGLIEPGAYHTGFNQRNIAKQFVWMDERSYFFGMKDALKKEQENKFKMLEVRSTEGMVKQIVQACEAQRPKLRYTAPWWQAFGVQVLRIVGK